MLFVIQAFILYQDQNLVDLLVVFKESVLLSAVTYSAGVGGQRGGEKAICSLFKLTGPESCECAPPPLGEPKSRRPEAFQNGTVRVFKLRRRGVRDVTADGLRALMSPFPVGSPSLIASSSPG